MATRMERYYESTETKERTKKNRDLYKEIYEETKYTNIEGIKTIEKDNEIDISQIKELLTSRSDYQKNRDYYQIIKPQKEEPELPKEEMKVEERNYDIREILNKAKIEKPVEEDHSLSNTQYDILKGINIKQEVNKNEYIEPTSELKDLISTITSTSVLNKMGDNELSLGILDDLKPSGNTEVIPPTVNEILKDSINEEPKEEMDKSFFTSSLNFKENDFEQLKDMNKNIKKNNGLMTVLIIIISLLIVAGIVYIILKF